LGVANDHSIAWAIAKALRGEGAEIAISYAGPAFERRVLPLAESLGVDFLVPCDVTRDEEVDRLFAAVCERWGTLDVLVHAIAFARREDLKGRLVDTSREGFHLALDVSAYSLVAVARRAAALMTGGAGSILTLTFLGSERVFPNYNVMGVAKAALEACVRYLAWDLGAAGIRVNAISAGPVRTLSAAGIAGFREMLHRHAERSLLQRNVSAEEVARTAVYLCSDLSSAVTGTVVFVDAGYHVVGV